MKHFLSALFLCFCFNNSAMETELPTLSPNTNINASTAIGRARANSASEATTVYIHQHYDATEALHREAACCFCTSRWILQPINVIAPLVSTGLIAVGEYFIDSDPGRASLLNGIGLGFSVAQFITSVLLLKVNNKLEGIDDYIETRRRQDGNNA